MPFDPPESDNPAPGAVQEREVRATAQRILAANLRPNEPAYWPDVQLDLTGATLVGADFSGCYLHGAKFYAVAWFHENKVIGDICRVGPARRLDCGPGALRT